MLNYSNSPQPKIPHFNVVIATPGNQMCSVHVKSLLATVDVLQKNNISWFYQNEYASLVTNAREATITGSKSLQVFNPSPGKGQYTYDKIFMIDSDIVWSPDQFLKLYFCDKSIVSGVYFEEQGLDAMIHRNKTDYCPMKRDEIENLQKDSKLIPVYGVGLGFISVKYGVFESLQRPWFGLGKVIQEVDGIDYEIPLGEDLFFCERIAEKGHQVYVDPTVIVGHVKSKIVC